jgi:hypothetical protein
MPCDPVALCRNLRIALSARKITLTSSSHSSPPISSPISPGFSTSMPPTDPHFRSSPCFHSYSTSASGRAYWYQIYIHHMKHAACGHSWRIWRIKMGYQIYRSFAWQVRALRLLSLDRCNRGYFLERIFRVRDEYFMCFLCDLAEWTV